jgi:hypothetical protein
MKRGIKNILFALVFGILLLSFASSEIIFTQQVKSVYNLGDTVYSPITIKTLTPISGIVEVNLVCNGSEINFYKNGINLVPGAEDSFDSRLVLIKNNIGGSNGACKIKAIAGGEYSLSNEFKISNWLSINGGLDKSSYNSGEAIAVIGKVTKETGENSNGLVEAYIETKDVNQNVTQLGTLTNGNFAFNLSIPQTLKAGSYEVNVRAYEEDNDGLITNSGTAKYNISVNQVPTTLEVLFESKEIDPGSSAVIHAVLHDQTGDAINSSIFVTVKDSTGKILEEKEMLLGEALIYPIAKGTAPAEWKILASSRGLSTENTFLIKTKESIAVEIVNKTIQITNDGNVFYNKTLLVKIEEEPLNILVSLDIGQTKKYILTAPKGEYTVKVLSDEGNEVSETMSLTGRAIGIKEQGNNLTAFAWVLLGLILLVAAFILLKKVKKRGFGRFKKEKISRAEVKEARPIPVMTEKAIIAPVNKAEVSLSIKGEKQEASVIGLKVKNLREFRVRKGSPSDTLKEIINLAQENKAVTYENNDYLLFILAPANTRTMKNEPVALELAQEIQKIMMNHNRMFNQKMNYGISLNKGEIVGKRESGVFKFMGIGNLIGMSKKIATLSDGDVLLSETMNNLLRVNIKSDKETRDGMAVYVLNSVKKENEETRKFINRFMERQKRE